MNSSRVNLIGLLVIFSLAFIACRDASRATNLPPSPPPVAVVTQVPPLPAGGADVLGLDTFAALRGASSDAVRLEVIDVQGQGFQKAWRVTGLKPVEQPYFSQLSAKNVAAITKDDVMVVQF